MSGITQDNRLLTVASSLGADALIATQLIGSEGLSRNFCLQLTAFTQVDSANLDSLIGNPLSITVNNTEQPLTFNGLVEKIEPLDSHYQGQQEYRFTLLPWSEQLKIDSNCQIYQNQSVVEIFTAICKAADFNDFDISKLTQSYPKLTYVVQYNESTWEFLNRILAEAGIFYYFVHSQDKHILTLADQSATLPNIGLVGFRSAQTEDAILAWQPQTVVGSNKITQDAYNYNTPNTDLLSSANQTEAQAVGGNTTLEDYHYPGNFQDQATAKSRLKQRLTIQNWQTQQIFGASTITGLITGKRFNLNNNYYVLITVEHEAHDHSHLQQQHGKAAYSYQNRFSCIPATLPYSPELLPAPALPGVQPAQVTGLDAAPVSSQTYTEVRVQFPWERNYIDAPNQYWLRAAQQTAGSMGAQFLPRSGDEVLTTYYYAQTNTPVILGGSYNDQNEPPFPLPAQQAQSGIKTQSVGGKGSNELSLIDAPGKELFNVYAQNSFNTNINNNETAGVQTNHTVNISGNHNTYLTQGKSTLYSPKQVVIQAGAGKITMTPNSLTLEGPQVSLGQPGSPVAMPPTPTFSPGTPVSTSANTNAANTVSEIAQSAYPSTTATFVSKEFELPEYVDGDFVVQTTVTISGKMKTTSKHSVNPASFDESGFQVQARQEANNVFTDLQIKKIDGDISNSVSATINNKYGTYTISLSRTLREPNIIQLKSDTENQLIKSEDSNWEVEGNVELEMEITAVRKNDPSYQSNLQAVEDYVTSHASEIKTALTGAVLIVTSAAAAQTAKSAAINAGQAISNAASTAKYYIDVFYDYETPIMEYVMGRVEI